MIFCAIDFESTGLDTAKDRITEIGAIQIDGPALSQLVYESDYPPITPEITELTGLTEDLLKSEGLFFVEVVEKLLEMPRPDYFIAHNKSFDEALFKAEMSRHKPELLATVGDRAQELFNIPWLCSIEDIEYPPKFKCRKLSHLALDLGIPVDPSKLHRAIDDVDLLVKLLVTQDLDKVVARSKIPWVIVRAVVPSPFGSTGDGGIGKDKAKACGFAWESVYNSREKFDKCWVKRIKKSDLALEEEKLGYKIAVLKE